MTKVEYSSCSGPSYTDLLPQASVERDFKKERLISCEANNDYT